MKKQISSQARNAQQFLSEWYSFGAVEKRLYIASPSSQFFVQFLLNFCASVQHLFDRMSDPSFAAKRDFKKQDFLKKKFDFGEGSFPCFQLKLSVKFEFVRCCGAFKCIAEALIAEISEVFNWLQKGK